jgi:hypothetical protein
MKEDNHHAPAPRVVQHSSDQLAGLAGTIAAAATLGMRFGVELATLASLAHWGASAHTALAARVLLALSAPLAAVVVWSRFLAPKAPRHLGGPAALVLELTIFALATLALASSGSDQTAAVYGSLATSNALLTRRLGQYAAAIDPPVAGGRSW